MAQNCLVPPERAAFHMPPAPAALSRCKPATIQSLHLLLRSGRVPNEETSAALSAGVSSQEGMKPAAARFSGALAGTIVPPKLVDRWCSSRMSPTEGLPIVAFPNAACIPPHVYAQLSFASHLLSLSRCYAHTWRSNIMATPSHPALQYLQDRARWAGTG